MLDLKKGNVIFWNTGYPPKVYRLLVLEIYDLGLDTKGENIFFMKLFNFDTNRITDRWWASKKEILNKIKIIC